MADRAYIENILNSVPDQQTQLSLKTVFRYLVQRGIAFGRATDPNTSMVRAVNMQGGFFTATTPSIANTEFAVAHNFGHAPYGLIPYMPLDQVNAAVVRLTNSKASDATYVYLKSPETSQPVYFYLEG